jgi:Zn-dependent protease/CBS domain-containing protein
MRWSWRLADIAGVGFYLHTTFLLLFCWVALLYWQQRQDSLAVFECLLFLGAIFSSVLFHDLAHVTMAKSLGIRVRDVLLLPTGGVIRLQSILKDPGKGFWIAIAGPAFSLVLSATIYLLLQASCPQTAATPPLYVAQGPFWQRLIWANLFLAGFNLLPALPMDGGTALRSILTGRLGYAEATRTTAALGQAATFVLGVVGFWTVSPFLLFLALCVWIGSTRESGLLQLRSVLRGVPVENVMLSGVHTLSLDSKAGDAASILKLKEHRDFAILDGEELVGVLTHQDLLMALAAGQEETCMTDLMTPTTQSLRASETLDVAVTKMLDSGCSALPVVRDNKIIGMLTQERIGEFISQSPDSSMGLT